MKEKESNSLRKTIQAVAAVAFVGGIVSFLMGCNSESVTPMAVGLAVTGMAGGLFFTMMKKKGNKDGDGNGPTGLAIFEAFTGAIWFLVGVALVASECISGNGSKGVVGFVAMGMGFALMLSILPTGWGDPF